MAHAAYLIVIRPDHGTPHLGETQRLGGSLLRNAVAYRAPRELYLKVSHVLCPCRLGLSLFCAPRRKLMHRLVAQSRKVLDRSQPSQRINGSPSDVDRIRRAERLS